MLAAYIIIASSASSHDMLCSYRHRQISSKKKKMNKNVTLKQYQIK